VQRVILAILRNDDAQTLQREHRSQQQNMPACIAVVKSYTRERLQKQHARDGYGSLCPGESTKTGERKKGK
jgi:hypothetical protein